MESSRRELLNDMNEHRPTLKNNQNTYHSGLDFTPKTGIAFPKTGFCLYCEVTAEYIKWFWVTRIAHGRPHPLLMKHQYEKQCQPLFSLNRMASTVLPYVAIKLTYKDDLDYFLNAHHVHFQKPA